jgi:23S rRNA (guanosine2251-2'-O)-methyltransferase
MRSKEFYVIAHNIRSLFNVGSIFRTSDAFKVAKIYLTGYTGTLLNPIHRKKISKVALGAENFVEWECQRSAVKLIKNLKSHGVTIVALENNLKTTELSNFRPRFPMVIILGEEVGGVDKKLLKLCDSVVEIPMRGQKESLNVSVAFGIAAFWISLKV